MVTEVKKWLDPHYRDKSITKEEYKEIVAKCVSKVSFILLYVTKQGKFMEQLR